MKPLLLTLLCALSLHALPPLQPRLRIVIGNENHHVIDVLGQTNVLKGLIGAAPNSAEPEAMTIAHAGANETLLLFNLEVVNVGGANWSPGPFIPEDDYGLPYLPGFLHITLLDADNGTVLAEQTQDLHFFAWDFYKTRESARQNFGWGVPGLSKACAGGGWLPQLTGSWLNIHGIPFVQRRVVLHVEIDPLGIYGPGASDAVEVGLVINGTDIHVEVLP